MRRAAGHTPQRAWTKHGSSKTPPRPKDCMGTCMSPLTAGLYPSTRLETHPLPLRPHTLPNLDTHGSASTSAPPPTNPAHEPLRCLWLPGLGLQHGSAMLLIEPGSQFKLYYISQPSLHDSVMFPICQEQLGERSGGLRSLRNVWKSPCSKSEAEAQVSSWPPAQLLRR